MQGARRQIERHGDLTGDVAGRDAGPGECMDCQCRVHSARGRGKEEGEAIQGRIEAQERRGSRTFATILLSLRVGG